MTLQDQIRSRTAYRDLKANPQQVLQNIRLTVGGLQHSDTHLGRAYFALDVVNNEIRMGENAGFVSVDADARIRVDALITPMRARNTAHRYLATAIIAAAGPAEFWITTRQTGCSVLVLDWGGNQYSMVHLQPDQMEDFNWLARGLAWTHSTVAREMRRFSLKQDLTRVVNTSLAAAHPSPVRYILVQTSHSIARGEHWQILGMKRNGGWDFYLQTHYWGHVQVQSLNWTDWYAYIPYMAY